MNIPDRLLFGQFLIEKKKTTQAILEKALEIQQQEHMNESPRMLGNILLNDYKIFKNRVELQNCLKDFDKFQLEMRDIFLDAKKYGVDPTTKLTQEYADLLEELETAETVKIREVILKIEKFRLELKNSRLIKEELEYMKEECSNKDREIVMLKNKIDVIEGDLKRKINSVRRYETFLKKKGYIDEIL